MANSRNLENRKTAKCCLELLHTNVGTGPEDPVAAGPWGPII